MLRYLTAGESHGKALSGIVEGAPAGLTISGDDINIQLARRWQGYGRGGRSKFEKDVIDILSGVRFGKTIGSPISLQLQNDAFSRDKAGWSTVMSVDPVDPETVDVVTLPRPGHADLVGIQKYRFDDIRPVIERASARETAMRVACCTIARQLLTELGIEVGSHVLNIGPVDKTLLGDLVEQRDNLTDRGAWQLATTADKSEVRMLTRAASEAAIDEIKAAKKSGDSLGGSYEVMVTGLIAGLGSYVHWDRRLDGRLAQAIMSIQGQKGVEIGDGYVASRTPGSRVHDPIVLSEKGYTRASNRAGGVEGGVTTGMPLVVRGYMKPIPTLIKPLGTVDIKTNEALPTRYERSDVTSVPAASTVAEAVVAFEVANAIIQKFGGDTMEELYDRFQSEKNRQAAAHGAG